ncbi:MAG: carbonic anhydrase [Rikenellaceae bacterium]
MQRTLIKSNMWYKDIFENNQKWVTRKLQHDPDYFKRLSTQQSPEYLYIGCSDSRVSIEKLMGLQPGELFVHRNIGNIVVNTDSNINAVIQYAVEHLHVKHIIVCGHYNCGGVKAAMHPTDMGQLNGWLQVIRDVYHTHRDELDSIEDIDERYDRLVELNVKEQCLNVMKIDHVQRSWVTKQTPQVHGWIVDLRTGLLKDLELNTRELFEEVEDIYNINFDHK